MRAAPVAKPAKAPKPPPVHGPWRFATLLIAPHRLGFAAAMLVLVVASLWWLAVQVDRVSGALGMSYVLAPSLIHAMVMVFGFMPLFFSGFLFTAGPRWLGVPPHAPTRTAPCVLLQMAGWLLWLSGAHVLPALAWAGLALVWLGMAWMVALFWQLIRASAERDRMHALTVGVGGLLGLCSLAGAALATVQGDVALALTLVRTGLWSFIVVTYVSVVHRMIPFFTSNVLPMIDVWRPSWVLWLMLGVSGFETLALWVEWWGLPPGAQLPWHLLCIALELAAGGVLLWLAVVWGLVQSLKIRLLAMLHVGFVWLGVALVFSALSHATLLVTGAPLLGLGALHALGMGFLGSLMLAMVTRVSCGHSGRALVADDLVWVLFGALQMAVMVRLLAAVQGLPLWLTLLAALMWCVVMLVWSLRYANWYGRPRFDGKPG